MDVSRLDGNVLAGSMASLLTSDPTMLRVECGGCGAVEVLADAAVERDEVAAIVRCRSCTHTLFTVMDHADGISVRIEALRAMGG